MPTEGATQSVEQDAIEKCHPSNLTTFSLAITRASFDKVTQTMRWKADASDTADDLYDDNMTLELFQDFIGRIEAGEQAPEEYRSAFWSGGMPYLSISHYPDLDGKAVPGPVERVFVDGSYLKAEGLFSDTPLGRACFSSVCNDLYGQNKDGQNKVRISIAFIDYKHRHKDTNFVFERKSLEDVCPECFQNMVTGVMEGKAPHPTLQGPKEFLRGLLIHLAMTRVPVNTRTLMEVDRAMTTRLEDAESIVGELADELEQQAKLVGKSEALVIKSDEGAEDGGTETEEIPELDRVPEKSQSTCKPDEEDEEGEEEPKKGKKGMKTEKSEAAPVEKMWDEPEAVWKPYGGATSLKDAQAVIDAQKEQWRVQDLWWMFQDVTNNIMSNPEIKDKGKAIAMASNEFKTLLGQETSKAMFGFLTMLSQADKPKPEPHPLDGVLDALKSRYDEQIATGLGADDILRSLQEPYAAIGETIRSAIGTKPEAPEVTEQKALDALMARMEQLSQSVNLMSARLDGLSRPASVPAEPAAPVRRSISPKLTLTTPQVNQAKSTTPKLRALIDSTT